MKNVFGINSENENDQIDGANLIIRKVSDETSQEIEKYQNDIAAIDEKASPSKIRFAKAEFKNLCKQSRTSNMHSGARRIAQTH